MRASIATFIILATATILLAVVAAGPIFHGTKAW